MRRQVLRANAMVDQPEVKRTNDGEFCFNYIVSVSLAREGAREVVYEWPQGTTPHLRDSHRLRIDFVQHVCSFCSVLSKEHYPHYAEQLKSESVALAQKSVLTK